MTEPNRDCVPQDFPAGLTSGLVAVPRTQATLRGRDRTAFAVALMVGLAAFFYWVALAFPASADKNDFSIDFSAAAPGS